MLTGEYTRIYTGECIRIKKCTKTAGFTATRLESPSSDFSMFARSNVSSKYFRDNVSTAKYAPGTV